MLLENKNAVIYGGGGSVGGAVDALDEEVIEELADREAYLEQAFSR